MREKSEMRPACTRCGSHDLGQCICRNCYENRFNLRTQDSLDLYISEFDAMFPELGEIDRASTLSEVESMADGIYAQIASRLSAYQLENFLSASDKISKARLNLTKVEKTGTIGAHGVGITFIVIGLILSAWSALKAPGFLMFLLPLGGIIFGKTFLYCKRCKKLISKKDTLGKKTVVHEKYGSHTEHYEVTTSSQHYDTRGKVAGNSTSSTYIPQSVRHVDETAEYVHQCNYCGHIWGVKRTKRFNLN